MLQTNVRLIIVPDEVELSKLANCSPEVIGTNYSDRDHILANEVENGYSILYTDEAITEVNPNDLVRTIINLFTHQFPDSIISLSINYCFQYIDESMEPEFDSEVAMMILRIAAAMMAVNNDRVHYYNSSDVITIRKILEEMRHQAEEPEQEEHEDDISSYLRGLGLGYEDDDDDDDDRPRRKKSRKKNYGHSRVMSHANKPKQAFKRHGVLIADSKDDLERDRQILKAFLKDFIPGDADWKREFRREVLKRWMDLYAISKKNLKRMEKQHRKAKHSKKNSVEKSMAMDFARRVLSVQQDRWNDPTK